MNRRILFIMFSIFLFSCTPTMTINQYADKNSFKLTKINNLSLFSGDIKLSNSPVKGEKYKTTFLLYIGDTLKFIARDKRIPKNEPYLFKFQKINDSVNIISHEGRNRYYFADTSLFSNNYCIRKMCVHDFYGIQNEKKIINLTFTIYHFDNGNLVYQDKNISPESFEKPESIFSFFTKISQGSISIPPYAIVPYKNKDSTMLNFFTSIFY